MVQGSHVDTKANPGGIAYESTVETTITDPDENTVLTETLVYDGSTDIRID